MLHIYYIIFIIYTLYNYIFYYIFFHNIIYNIFLNLHQTLRGFSEVAVAVEVEEEEEEESLPSLCRLLDSIITKGKNIATEDELPLHCAM